MDLDSSNSILNLNSYRVQKQLQGEASAIKLYNLAQAFTERNANIREKVRAKDLFRKMLHLHEKEAFTSIQEKAFSEWFLFDYMTAQGLTMFNLFLRKHSQQLLEPELIQGALFLTSVFEPVKVLKIESSSILVEEDYTKAHGELVITTDLSLKENNYYFIRSIPVVHKAFALGSIYPIFDNRVLEEMYKEYDMTRKLYEQYSIRAFLKKNAIKYLFR